MVHVLYRNCALYVHVRTNNSPNPNIGSHLYGTIHVALGREQFKVVRKDNAVLFVRFVHALHPFLSGLILTTFLNAGSLNSSDSEL